MAYDNLYSTCFKHNKEFIALILEALVTVSNINLQHFGILQYFTE